MVKIKIKERIFEIDNNISLFDFISIANKLNGIYDNNLKLWIFESRISIFEKLLNIITDINFKQYFDELKKTKYSKQQSNSNNNDLKTKFPFLYPFQLEALKKITASKHKGFLLGLEMGLGKTLVSICSAIEMKMENVWVVCPASLLNQWKKEIIKWTNTKEDNILIYKGTKLQREKAYQSNCQWNIISYETLKNDLKNNPIIINKFKSSFVIADEATKLKNKTTQIYKTFQKITKIVEMKLFLSGTPISNALQDIDNIINLIDKNIIYNIHNYLVKEEKTFGYGWNARIINIVVGYKNLDEYNNKIKPVYFRETKESIASQIKKKNLILIDIEQTNHHNNLKNQILNEYTLFTGFTLLQSLDVGIEVLQKSKSENIELIDFPLKFDNPKLEMLKELINEIDDKVIIYTRFIEGVNIIEQMLKKEFPNLKIKSVTSETKDSDTIQNQFNNTNEIDIVIATDTWSRGVNLSNIDYMINFDVSPSYEIYKQRQDRIHRIDSKNPKFIYYLVGSIIEKHVMDILKEKEVLVQQVTEGKAVSMTENDIRTEVMNRLQNSNNSIINNKIYK